ncbi:MAG: signal peptidase II [Candidatus Latescibacterota bacterium]|nr:signal peptidase II [Candidatus Latescibacterota bacterium]
MHPLFLIPFTILIDQASKLIVRFNMQRGESIEVVGNFFQLTYIHNPGAAFGFNLGSPILHTVISVCALCFLIYLYRNFKNEEIYGRFGICLVLGGAVGNIIDRIYLGEVVDFFDVGWGGLRWPIFNFADSFVTVGVLVLIFIHSAEDKSGVGDSDQINVK